MDTVAGDDVINIVEHGQHLMVTGTSTGLSAGSALTVTVNGKTYPATVLADGSGAPPFLRLTSVRWRQAASPSRWQARAAPEIRSPSAMT